VSTYGLTNDDEFTINIKPDSGAVVTIGRSIPAQINTRMSLR
jgi:archaellin